jgi:hypothetical protein
MKTVKISFNSLHQNEFVDYVDKATKVHEMGLHLDKSVLQLAELIYVKTLKNNLENNYEN